MTRLKNTGKSSEQLFEDFYKKRWGRKVFIHRVTDSAEVNGRHKGRTKAVVKAQPSDFICTVNGEMEYAEVKSSNNKTSFPFGSISRVQLGSAKLQKMAGGNYFFYLHNKVADMWYRVEGETILTIQAQGKSSVKWDYLDTHNFKWELTL